MMIIASDGFISFNSNWQFYFNESDYLL